MEVIVLNVQHPVSKDVRSREMIFSREDLVAIEATYLEVQGKYEHLLAMFADPDFENARAREFARHGFARRLMTLRRCIENVFRILPPDRTEPPTSEELSDAAINIQAFITNVFGSIDNLAWILVHERNIRREDGRELSKASVGLRPGFNYVLNTLSPPFQQYLESLAEWLSFLESFRHSLAHRIPLYIPPYFIAQGQRNLYQDLEQRLQAAFIANDDDEYARLEAQQDAIKSYYAYMTHSLEEEAGLVAFHPQMLADFNTIFELGRRLLEELGVENRP